MDNSRFKVSRCYCQSHPRTSGAPFVLCVYGRR